MRTIYAEVIEKTVERLCIEANTRLAPDVFACLRKALHEEESETGIDTIKILLENAEIAREQDIPICQDTGMAVVFVEIGTDVFIHGGSIEAAINRGVANGYRKGFLRNSTVADPIVRVNTGDNTPAVIHYEVKQGEELIITVAPKGFGSENMSALKMLKPSDGIEGIKKFILETVENAGPNPCPPIVAGVGIGGTMEKAALLSKKALLRTLGENNPKEHIKALEVEMLDRINRTGIGPSGLGGRITALAVNIEVFPTHIAGLPVSVNISCHALRHASAVL